MARGKFRALSAKSAIRIVKTKDIKDTKLQRNRISEKAEIVAPAGGGRGTAESIRKEVPRESERATMKSKKVYREKTGERCSSHRHTCIYTRRRKPV